MKYCSFDIFDTCFVRSCGQAEAVFDILAKDVLGPEVNPAWHMDFARERILGESRARQALDMTVFEEVTIADIYNHCDFSSLSSIPNAEIMQKEIDIEKKVLVPVRSILDKIETLRKKDVGIAFISDMYLPRDIILNLLKDAGFFRQGDKLYLSCDIGKTKATGSLFRHVLDDLKIKPSQLEHFGDNDWSDVSVPHNMGIATKRIRHRRSEYEQMLCSRDCSGQFMDINVLASISKAVRLTVADTPENKFAADFVATIFVPFVFSILKDARKRGLHRLLFFARDAYIFYVIARQFSCCFPEIDLKYVYVSRKSLYLPGMESTSFDSIAQLFWDFRNASADEILDRLHMPGVDSAKYCTKGKDPASVLSSMLEDEDFIERLEHNIIEQREAAVAYLTGEGLGEDGCGIVDLTGTRKSHLAVNRILATAGLAPAYGYYFSVHESRVAGTDYCSLFFEDRFDRNNLNLSLRPHDLFEQYFCITDQDRTCAYRKNGDTATPVFEPSHMSKDYCTRIMSANLNVCKLFAAHYLTSLKHSDEQNLVMAASSVYSYFYYVPRKEYLMAFKDLTLSESALSSNIMFKKRLIFATLRDRKAVWKIGEMMMNFPFPSLLFKLLRKRYFISLSGSDRKWSIDFR